MAPNEARDNAAKALLDRKQVGASSFDLNTKRLTLQCYSAGALSVDKDPVIYDIHVDIGGATTCTCTDFQRRGGACKHIRAALLSLDALRRMGKNLPSIPIPTSEDEAGALEGLFASTLTSLDVPGDGSGPIKRAAESVADEVREGKDIYEEREEEGQLDGGDSTEASGEDGATQGHDAWMDFQGQLTGDTTSIYASASEMDISEPGHGGASEEEVEEMEGEQGRQSVERSDNEAA